MLISITYPGEARRQDQGGARRSSYTSYFSASTTSHIYITAYYILHITHYEFDILTSRLSENGWKLRLKVYSDTAQAYKAMPTTATTRTLAEILQLVPLEDAEQISSFQGLVYTPEQFMEK